MARSEVGLHVIVPLPGICGNPKCLVFGVTRWLPVLAKCLYIRTD